MAYINGKQVLAVQLGSDYNDAYNAGKNAATTTRTGSYDLCRGSEMTQSRTYTVAYYVMRNWK